MAQPFHYKRILLILAVAATVMGVMLAARAAVIGSADAHLKTMKLSYFHISGTRIPCAGAADVGVFVMYVENGVEKPARLCTDLSSDWTWHPLPGRH
jgi:hypothetical protein